MRQQAKAMALQLLLDLTKPPKLSPGCCEVSGLCHPGDLSA